MFLKNLIIGLMLCLSPLTVQAGNSVVLEFGWGIGGKNLCENRNTDAVFIRVRHNTTEAHWGQWKSDNCTKTNSVVGLGYVLQTNDYDTSYYVGWTPGVAYLIEDKDIVVSNRLTLGLPINYNQDLELSLLFYGDVKTHDERFFTAGMKAGSLYGPDPDPNQKHLSSNNDGDDGDGGDDGDDEECKPGWGHGDDNHCHDGPPGQE